MVALDFVDVAPLPDSVADDADLVVEVAELRIEALHRGALRLLCVGARRARPGAAPAEPNRAEPNWPGTMTFSLCGE